LYVLVLKENQSLRGAGTKPISFDLEGKRFWGCNRND